MSAITAAEDTGRSKSSVFLRGSNRLIRVIARARRAAGFPVSRWTIAAIDSELR